MVKKITIYGWAVPEDRFRGPGSGTFVDLTYFLDDTISVGDILNAINRSGFKFIPLRYPSGHPLQGQVVSDKVTITDVTFGIEPVQPGAPGGMDIEIQQQQGFMGNEPI